MARGWDDGGAIVDYSSWRSICGGQGGGGDCLGGAGRMGFRPNVLVGLCPIDNSPPAVAGGFGVSDISLEYWHCWKIIYTEVAVPPNVPFDTTGLWLNVGGPPGVNFNMYVADSAHSLLSPTGVWVALDPDTAIPPGIRTAVPLEIPLGWAYVAVNFDRNGNMDTYINGQLVNSTAIGAMVAENFENSRFYAKTTCDDIGDPALFNGTLEDVTTYWAGRYIVGPIALHTRLMTVAEIQNSYRGKRVQNFGAAATAVCWHWQDVERLDGDPVCWDFVEGHTHHANLIGLQGCGVAMPLGAAGTIRVPDRSGNNNHWTLPTLASYQRTAALTELSSTAFLYDPFWVS